ncbi:MAG TPA: phosphoribosylanthranilate isomerase [Granulicella sp.]|nr:phosphoribosylanthranilate isomerase [Granulicella sp.]
MWIKICANTNLADAQLAADLGADALGFVFAPSKRQVTVEQVAAITPHLPSSVATIAVVETRSAPEIAALVRATGLTGVQLHGGLDLPLVRALRAELGPSVAIFQTLHWVVDTVDTEDGNGVNNTNADSAALVAAQLREVAAEPAIAAVLLDAKVGNAGGGTGRSFDWNAARETLAAASEAAGKPIHLIVAGGLRPENVTEAMRALRPWGVDVASGVEAAPGRKDPLKLKRFLENARTPS